MLRHNSRPAEGHPRGILSYVGSVGELMSFLACCRARETAQELGLGQDAESVSYLESLYLRLNS